MKLYIKAIAALMMLGGGSMAFTSCTEDSVYNIDVNAVPEASAFENNAVIDVDQETNTATFTFTGKGVYPVWIIDGKQYSTSHSFSRFYRKAGDYSVELKVANANGMSKGTVTKTFHVDRTKMNGFPGFVYDSEFNLWTKATKQINSFYYAPGWAQLPDPEHTFNADEITLKLPEATTDQWQAQMHVGTDICLTEGESYDGSLVFTATQDMKNITVKIHPDGDDDDAHSFFPQQKVNLTAGEPAAFFFSDLPAAVDMNNVVYTFDFGGNPAGVEIIIENIVLKKHSDDDGTELPELPTTPEPTWVDANSADNLWHGVQYTTSFYYAPGWAQIADPGFTDNGDGSYSISLPTATSDQWQAQVKMHTELPIPDPAVAYDFKVTIESNNALNGVTVKLTQTDEIDADGNEVKHDGNFLFAEQVSIPEGGSTTFWTAARTLEQGTAAHKISLVLDFGGCPENTEVKVSNIILQVHHD